MSEILDAAAYNDLPKLKKLLQKHAGSLKQFWHERTSGFNDYFSALHYTIYNYKEKKVDTSEMLRLLLKNKFCMLERCTGVGAWKNTVPLQYAVNKEAWPLVRVFSEFKNDVDDIAGYQYAALAAIKAKQFDIAVALLKKIRKFTNETLTKEIVAESFKSKNNNLIHAVVVLDDSVKIHKKYLDANIVEKYIRKQKYEVGENISEVLRAAANHDVSTLKGYLAGDNENIEMYRNEATSNWTDNFTALHFAVYNYGSEINTTELVRFLLQNKFSMMTKCGGVTSENPNYAQTVPLRYAVNIGAWPLVRVFSEFENDVDDMAGYQYAALEAIKAKKYVIAGELLKRIKKFTNENISREIVYQAIKSNDKSLINIILSPESTSLKRVDFNNMNIGQYIREHNDVELIRRYYTMRGTIADSLIEADANNEDWSWVLLFLESNAWAGYTYSEVFGKLLHIAILQNNVEIVGKLLQFSHIPKNHKQSIAGYEATPLVRAAMAENWVIVDMFALYPSGANDEADYGAAMVICAYQQQLALALRLLKQGADADKYYEPLNTTALAEAIKNAHIDNNLFYELLKVANLNKLTNGEKFPIDLAFKCSDRSSLLSLVESGVEVFPLANPHVLHDAEQSKWHNVNEFLNWTQHLEQPEALLGELLHIAVEQSNDKQVKHLIGSGANRGYVSDEKTPIARAVDCGFWNIVKAMAEYSVNEDDHGLDYDYALVRAARIGDFALVEILLNRGAKPNRKIDAIHNEVVIDVAGNHVMQAMPEAYYDYTSLHFAVTADQPALVVKLLEHNIDVNQVTKNKLTPLRLAIQHNRDAIIKILLAAECDVTTADMDALLSLATRGYDEDWQTIKTVIGQNASVEFDEKYTYYNKLLKCAIDQRRMNMVILLKPFSIEHPVNTSDKTLIIHAVKNKRWQSVYELTAEDFASQHGEVEDYLIALFYCVINYKNRLVTRILDLKLFDESMKLSSGLNVLAEFDVFFVGFDALKFSIYHANHAMMEFFSERYKGEDLLSSSYLDTAFFKKNETAIKYLASRCHQPNTSLLIKACNDDQWTLVENYLENAKPIHKLDDLYAGLLRESEAIKSIDTSYLLQQFAQQFLAPQKHSLQVMQLQGDQLSLRMINVLSGMLSCTVAAYVLGFLDASEFSVMFTGISYLLWQSLHFRYPENPILNTIDNHLNGLFSKGFAKLNFFEKQPIIEVKDDVLVEKVEEHDEEVNNLEAYNDAVISDDEASCSSDDDEVSDDEFIDEISVSF